MWERAVRWWRAAPGALLEPWAGAVVNSAETVRAFRAEVPGRAPARRHRSRRRLGRRSVRAARARRPRAAAPGQARAHAGARRRPDRRGRLRGGARAGSSSSTTGAASASSTSTSPTTAGRSTTPSVGQRPRRPPPHPRTRVNRSPRTRNPRTRNTEAATLEPATLEPGASQAAMPWAVMPVRGVGVLLCDDRWALTRLITAVGARSAWYLRELAPPGPRGTSSASNVPGATRARVLVRCPDVHAPVRHRARPQTARPRSATSMRLRWRCRCGPNSTARCRWSCRSTTRRPTATSPRRYCWRPRIAARTSTVPIMVAALLVPLHDPVRLAEDMAVLDVISRGRVGYVAGLGYRPEEYSMFGRSLGSAAGAWTSASRCCSARGRATSSSTTGARAG